MASQELSGTTAVVTGASRGFGRGIAVALAQAGARVVGVARDGARLAELGDQLGGSFTPVIADAADPVAAGHLLDEYRPRTLVLNAGASPLPRPIHQHTWQTFSRNWDVDVQHVFGWTREALLLPLQPGSTVIAMSSGAAVRGSPLSGGYAGAKATIRFIADYAAAESQRENLGIRLHVGAAAADPGHRPGRRRCGWLRRPAGRRPRYLPRGPRPGAHPGTSGRGRRRPGRRPWPRPGRLPAHRRRPQPGAELNGETHMSQITAAPAVSRGVKQVRRWRAFAVLAVAYFMTVADLAIVNVALPTIGRQLHIAESDLQWVVTAYALTFGGFLLLGGRAADLLGRRRILLAGLALFTAASLGCGLATAEGFLIAMRCLEGLGAAIVLPAALSIVMNMFPEGAERNKALGAWGAIGASGATVGVMAGGLLTRYVGWEYIFYLNVPIGAVALALAPRIVPESRLAIERRRFDPFGAVTVTGGISLLVYAISTAPQVGWDTARTVSLLAVSVALLAAFLVIETRVEAPLMPLRIFRLKTLAGGNAVGFLLGGSFFAFIFIGTLYMQQVLGYSALRAGLAWLATSLTSVAFAGLAQALVTRGSAKLVLAAGMTMIGGGALWATQVPADGHFWANLAGPFLITGVGTAPPLPPLRLRPGVHRRPRGRRRTRGRPGLRADQHLPAARRRDRRRGGVNDRRQPRHRPAAPGRRAGRRADRRLRLGVLGLRHHRPGRRPGHLPAGPPQRTGPGRGQHDH